jgi:hypothetical protein
MRQQQRRHNRDYDNDHEHFNERECGHIAHRFLFHTVSRNKSTAFRGGKQDRNVTEGSR